MIQVSPPRKSTSALRPSQAHLVGCSRFRILQRKRVNLLLIPVVHTAGSLPLSLAHFGTTVLAVFRSVGRRRVCGPHTARAGDGYLTWCRGAEILRPPSRFTPTMYLNLYAGVGGSKPLGCLTVPSASCTSKGTFSK